MKKYVKLVAVIILSALLCLSFCSCIDVDELREQTARWGNEEHTVINFKGAEYKLLPQCDELYIVPSGVYFDGYVTDSEVPILLAENYGEGMNVGKDAEMLVAGVWKNNLDCNRVYCRSDLYDTKVKAIQNFELDCYCIYDPSFDKETGEIINEYRLLKAESVSAIRTALSDEAAVIDGFNRSGEGIYICDETMQFIENADKGAKMWVTYIGGKPSVVVESFDTSSKIYNFMRYDVPEEFAESIINDVKPFSYGYDYDY